MTYKVHLDGYNFLPFLKGEEAKGPRREFFYFADTGVLEALRWNNWKMHFRISPENIWDRGPELKVFPQLLNLRSDPFEEGMGAMAYKEWMFKHVYALVPAQAIVGRFIQSLKDYPPRQKVADFGLDRVLEQLYDAKPT